MGFKDTKWAYTLDLTATECAVLVALCTMTDDKTHETYASQDTLARMAKVTRPTVNKVLGVLESRNIIARKKRFDANGQRAASLLTANVGKANVDDTNVGLKQGQCHPDAEPTSATPTATSINQIDQPEDQPDIPATELVLLPAGPPTDLDHLFGLCWEGDEGWPKKVDRKDALAKFKIVCRKHFQGREHELVAAIRLHARAHALHTERQFIPGLAVWLNKERWNNPLPEAPATERRKPTRNERNIAALKEYAAKQSRKGIAS